jgi:hypothetical protein
MGVYERAEKILALSNHHVVGSARRIDGSYVWIGSCAFHLHNLLEQSVCIAQSMLLLLDLRFIHAGKG